MSVWTKFVDIVKTGLMSQDDVKKYLKDRMESHFKTAKESINLTKAKFVKNKQLGALQASCTQALQQANGLEAFMLQESQLNTLSRVFYSKAKEMGSIDGLKSTLLKSPAVKDIKALMLNLISSELYDGLVPLADKLGDFAKLSQKEQLLIIALLENEDIEQKIGAIDVKATFEKLVEKIDVLAEELKLTQGDHDALKRIIATIKNNHLVPLDKIKKDVLKHIKPIKAALLKEIVVQCPELLVHKQKPAVVAHAKVKAGKLAKRKDAPVKTSHKKAKVKTASR
ncbi:MAG: hypothetical protein AB7V32_00255 [Candidatus Berkiella sp.]